MNSIRKIAVCGAGGTMGAGIALVAARAGFETLCQDQSAEALARARAQAQQFFDRSVQRGRMSAEAAAAALARMHDVTDLGALADCDLVIEAVFEDLGVKQSLLAELDRLCKPETLFASNTSTLSITEIASGCGRPERVIGLHFCLPAQLMKLIEVSRGMLTAQDTFDAAWAWCKAVGQLPVQTQDRPGFILNAVLVPFNNDVLRIIDEGVATPEDIDTAICSALGYRMGPCTLLDLIGLDTQVRLGEAFYPITHDPRAAVPAMLRRRVAAGLLGNKSGRGLLGAAPPRVPATAAPAFALLREAGRDGRSFAPDDPFLARAVTGTAQVLVCLGGAFHPDPARQAVLVELDTECLGVHTGEDVGNEGSNVLGFARYRNGNDAPSDLVEIVYQPQTDPAALEAARAVFEAAGLVTVVCADRPGRIVDRLVRPKYNDALRFLDEGLARAEDMDTTCRLGLGYPDGPIERVVRGGLERHYEICMALARMTGQAAYHPARRAVVAHDHAGRTVGAD